MKTKSSRRQFLNNSSKIAVSCCLLAAGSKLGFASFLPTDEMPDPKKLNYCGYTCPDDCKMKKATIENDVELKKEAFKDWKLEDRYGLSFDAEKVFCYGCKQEEEPQGPITANCPVRACNIEKGIECCIECDELSGCDKELWKLFPDFHNSVIEAQRRYQTG